MPMKDWTKLTPEQLKFERMQEEAFEEEFRQKLAELERKQRDAEAAYQTKLSSFPTFAIAVVIFLSTGRDIFFVSDKPEWLQQRPDLTIPEFDLIPGKSIEESAADGIKELYVVDQVDVSIVETRPRGDGGNGVVTICYAALPKSRILRSIGSTHMRTSVANTEMPFLFGYRDSVRKALRALAFNPSQVAKLIGTPYFTLAELSDGLNYVRNLAGIKSRVDIRNLRRQVEGADWLKDSGRLSSGAHRPAKLYLP